VPAITVTSKARVSVSDVALIGPLFPVTVCTPEWIKTLRFGIGYPFFFVGLRFALRVVGLDPAGCLTSVDVDALATFAVAEAFVTVSCVFFALDFSLRCPSPLSERTLFGGSALSHTAPQAGQKIFGSVAGV
jgi:hypothetical protein